VGKRRYELDTRVLAVFFLVAMPFLAVGSLVIIGMARAAVQEAAGAALEQRALETKQQLEHYLEDQIGHLIQTAQEAREKLPAGRTAPTAENARQREQGWTSGDPALVGSIVGSPLGARLREVGALHSAVRLLQVVDAQGRLLASSARGGRLLNSETPWFRALTADEPAPAFVGDVQRPPQSATALIEIAVPIRGRDGRMLGAVRSLIDAYDVYNQVFAPVRLGTTGHAVLLRTRDGLILASDENQRVLQDRFQGFEILQAAQGARRGHWTLPEIRQKTIAGEEQVEAKRVVGLSPVDRVRGAEWTVVVEQDLAEATAPIQGLTWQLVAHFLAVFLMALVLAFYFSFKLETPVIEEELHLHEEHVPASMRIAS
jgi:hypothetical protein